MGFYRANLVTSFLIFTISVPSFGLSKNAIVNHGPKQCQALERQAIEMVDKMNAMFGLDVVLQFIERPGYTEIPEEFGGGSEELANEQLTLMDSNAGDTDDGGRAVVQVPKPCLLKERKLPSTELWALILTHEYSHTVLDSMDDHCIEIFETNFKRRLSETESLKLDDIQHSNADVLGLKIISHFGINGAKAISDLRSYVNQPATREDLGDEDWLTYRKRIAYMDRIWPTSFKQGTDLLAARYFDVGGLNLIQSFLRKNYPQSSLMKDVQAQNSRTIKGCLMPKPKSVQRSLSIWDQLGNDPFLR